MANTARFGSTYTPRRMQDRGDGYLGGLAPASADPDADDGRARKLNVPSAVRITAFERTTMRAVAETISRPDGTWRIDWLDRTRKYYVIGWDDRGQVNAAIQDWVTAEKAE